MSFFIHELPDFRVIMRGGGLWQLGQSITRRLAQKEKKAVTRRFFGSEAELKKTALYDFHVAHGGKMVPFAGWSMPIQYKDSIMDSTVNCRENGSLFDVAHMCGLSLKGKDCIPFLEKLVIADVAGLAPGTGTLTVFTNDKGGAIDDSVITKVKDDHIYVVVNAGCRDKDLAHIEEHMKAFKAKGGDVSWHIHDERSLLALQVKTNCYIHDLKNKAITFLVPQFISDQTTTAALVAMLGTSCCPSSAAPD